jgi:hypothetical protein
MSPKPSDFWPPSKREWYDDRTGKLKDPHRSRLIANGMPLERIVEMEAEIEREIAEFYRKNPALYSY